MYENILKLVLGRKQLFVPLIFTEKQFSTLNKYSHRSRLSNAEKKSLYTSIKKKMQALSSFSREHKEAWINNPQEIIASRVAEAKRLIEEYSKEHDKVFISGSFLFLKEFKDIDIFIVRTRGYKESWDNDKHVIFLSDKKLADPVFQSASLISVSNFCIPQRIKLKKPSLSDIMTTYHESVIEHLNKENKPDAVRRLIFDYNLHCKDRLLNGKELKELSKKVILDDLDLYVRGLCKKLFSESYLYVEVHDYIKTLKESIKNIKPNNHLIRFKNAYEEMIYGKTGAA